MVFVRADFIWEKGSIYRIDRKNGGRMGMILELNQEISNFGMVNLRKSNLAMAHPPFMTMIFAIKTPNLLGNCPIARYDYYIEGIEGIVIESGGSSESLSVCNRCWIDMDL